jgi:RHS repeat-associated protein
VGKLGYYWQPDLGNYWLRARVYDPQRGRYVSKAPMGEQLGGEHPYAYAASSPIAYVDPDGLQATTYETFAIAESGPATKISAKFTLPMYCTVRPHQDDFVIFYLSMDGGYEGGVSFSYKEGKGRTRGWAAFLNANGNQQYVPISLSRGQTVQMTLELKSTFVEFRINDAPPAKAPLHTPLGRPTRRSSIGPKFRTVNAAGYQDPLCPPTHSDASWSDVIVSSGGMRPGSMRPRVWPRVVNKAEPEIITSRSPNPLVSHLGVTRTWCDTSHAFRCVE